MENKNFNISFLVDQTPNEVFKAITNVRGWWSEAAEGDSENLNDEFTYIHGDIHYSKHRVVEVFLNKKVVWLTLDSRLSFVEKQDEWNGTKVIFEITEQDGKTKLEVTHVGLVPEFQCFEGCSKGWTHYLENSLIPLIVTGTGNPDRKENM
ncbi:SRPBCC domain-containing protein [Chryseobacterium sp. JAH]|uniref:SRPBCC family protein n=1 Tax=Chryseobacterium sp. JAH TaxID=1742858 RepID=UPI0007413616|nr:SRPBCC domain-containing protein [Chryseobacterium sp. JAH]KUJ50828.1 ATPase [Chryseobacterium sp. JAH]